MIDGAKAQVRALVDRLVAPLAEQLGVERTRIDALEARAEQLGRADERLLALADRHHEELGARIERVGSDGELVRSLAQELVPDGDLERAGEVLALRLAAIVRHADVRAEELRVDQARAVGELKRSFRLTQTLMERVLALEPPAIASGGAPAPGEPGPGAAPVAAAATPTGALRDFDHPVPRFDLLYRAFEDRHRGSRGEIRDRQRDDWLELLGGLPRPDLPVADLGCGRGELLELLGADGIAAIGVDANTSQLEGLSVEAVEADLFDWLDGRPDASLRAVVSLHVVEHLDRDLQVRLVFEAARTLVEGGVLILETPNTTSLSIGASNFWVDPTHERPVHPLYLEFLAEEAGFASVGTRYLHPVPVGLRGGDVAADLVEDLDSLLFGPGDLALVARR